MVLKSYKLLLSFDNLFGNTMFVIVVIIFSWDKILQIVKIWSYMKYASDSGIKTAYLASRTMGM